MKTLTPRISKAIDIFLDAINNGTLAKGTCAACAVSNLVTVANNIQCNNLDEQREKGLSSWSDVFCTNDNKQSFNIKYYRDKAKKQIDSTDFSLNELAAIEYAFETNTKIRHYFYEEDISKEVRADQIKGLEAVVKVMMTFDEVEAEVKEVFTKQAELIEL